MPFGRKEKYKPDPVEIEVGLPFLPLSPEDRMLGHPSFAGDAGTTGSIPADGLAQGPGKLPDFIPDVRRIGRPELRETAEQRAERRKLKVMNFILSFMLRLSVFFGLMAYYNTNYYNTDPDTWFLILFGLFLLDCFRAVNKAATHGTI